jgi:hypothetical protein
MILHDLQLVVSNDLLATSALRSILCRITVITTTITSTIVMSGNFQRREIPQILVIASYNKFWPGKICDHQPNTSSANLKIGVRLEQHSYYPANRFTYVNSTRQPKRFFFAAFPFSLDSPQI